ncbi:uncharacterized protein LOC124854953 isoform X1 [Hippoglossus stenolepis]|uniref:uncharacterized protein LOC124854953 isoform X1 n=1 Tax=Hippoglossus stenolepis TaxID=195615 RepID=UPI0017D32A52|nr:uncharacterized protein LOC124854953 isoform X1 [Hippoglossus stenolepis]
MSVDGTRLLFEGFLQKRKDTIKIRWATYWFRLQNTTLFFYTKKNGSASHLRGYYYIYTVQSVREVPRADSSRFMFEIVMKNGKRKMLAAETADLRKQWIGQLWQAMHLSGCRISDVSPTHFEGFEQRDGLNSTMGPLPVRPNSAPTPSIQSCRETRSVVSAVCLPQELNSEEAVYAMPSACKYQHLTGDGLNVPQRSSGLSSAQDRQEEHYDVLPLRNKKCEIGISTQMSEVVYDTPQSYRPARNQDPEESIYDTPSSLLRERPAHTADREQEDGVYWRI